ncbi:MAG: TRAP transporter small permease [Alphaproteobacteria bacterium]|nr:TRAP transporter small permease [Alphaproteobacteria bacterium]
MHQTGPQSFMDKIEERLIAVILGVMTVITFANVIARFLDSNILWALEATVFLFAWLVLLGASYAVKIRGHLGVDAILNIVSPGLRRVMGILAAAVCVSYALLLLKGSWDYWAIFADLPPTSGRVIPTGFEDRFRSQSFYEVQDIPMLDVFRFLEDWINYGESYEKMPKVIPYIVMPLSMALLLYRFLQAAARIASGKADMMIASHEVEDAIEDAAKTIAEADRKGP